MSNGRNYNSPQLSTIIIAQQLKSMLQSKSEVLFPSPILLERMRDTNIQVSVLTVIIVVVVIVFTTARTWIIGRFYAAGLSSLSKVNKFLFFFRRGGRGRVFAVLLAPFPEKGILDCIAHRPIIQVFTVLWLSGWLNFEGDRCIILPIM